MQRIRAIVAVVCGAVVSAALLVAWPAAATTPSTTPSNTPSSTPSTTAAEDLVEAGRRAMSRGDHAEAVRQFQAAAGTAESESGPQAPRTLAALNWLAQAQLEAGQHTQALATAERVLAQRVAQLGEADADTLDVRITRVRILLALGRAAEALAQIQAAHAQATKSLGERHPQTVRAMVFHAQALSARGRLGEARDMAAAATQLSIELHGETHPATGVAIGNLAIAERDLGRVDLSLALNERELKARQALLGERHVETAASMSNLARDYRSLGRYAEQAALDAKALAISQELRGERHPATLSYMNNLASAQFALGRYAESLALNERVLRLRTEILGERHPLTLTSMNNLGAVYRELRRTEEETALVEKAVRLRSEVLGPHHPNTLNSMSNLGRTYLAAGRIAEALAIDERTLKARRETQGETHPETMMAMSNLAFAYYRAGRTADGLALNERVLELRREARGPRHPDTLVSMTNVAVGYSALGRRREAAERLEEVVALRTQVLGAQHPTTLETIGRLVGIYALEGRPREAAALAARFVEGAEAQRSQPGLGAANRRSIFRDYARTYRQLSVAHGVTGDAAQGFRLAELGKARTLLESMTAQRAGRSGLLPEEQQAALDDLGRQVAAHDQLIAQARSAEARLAFDAARNALVRTYEALELRLRAEYPRYAQLGTPRLIEAGDLPGLVGRDEVAVSYLIHGEEGVAAWVVDAGGKPRLVDLGRLPRLADAVALVRLAAGNPRGLRAALADEGRRAWRTHDGAYHLLDSAQAAPEGASAVSDESEVAGMLGRRLLEPLAEVLRHKERWVLSPDGALATLPFELLHLDGKRVLERVELHYAQSLSVYALARARLAEYGQLQRPFDLLAFGHPSYDAPPEPAGTRRARLRAAPLVAETQLADLRTSWPSLPGTEREIQVIRRLYSASTTYLRSDASEARLQQLAASGELTRYRRLHFAVHGHLSAQDPALSSLVLSQRNLAPGTDGYVTAAEWAGYELRSDLTVLSACDTGLGADLSGEGVMGLPFALFMAGNVNTVLSLWPVLDETAPRFMQKFYARLRAGIGAARALTETKREIAADPRSRHPAHWAPFILVGAG